MKKFILVSILALVTVGVYCAGSIKKPDWACMISDALTGYSVKVDSVRNIQTSKFINTNTLTADGIVNSSGKPCTVFAVTFSDATANQYMKIYDGGNSNKTLKWTIYTGTAYVSHTVQFPGGLDFAQECYVDFESATGTASFGFNE